MTDFNLSNWLLTFQDDLDLNILPLKMCISISYSYISNIKLQSAIVQKLWQMSKYLTFDLCGWPLHVNSNLCSFKSYTCMSNIKLLSKMVEKFWPMLKYLSLLKNLTFDLDGWPRPYQFAAQNVQLYEIHMYIKYEVSENLVKKL